jgi:uncharacterized protein (DUF697 family)
MARSKLPIAPLAVYRLLKEVRAAATDDRPLAVGGARELAAVLCRDLSRGAADGAVREAGDVRGAAALVYVLAGAPSEDDERALREASAARVPIVCVLADPGFAGPVPYVLATDLVRVPPGSGFPLEQIADALARRLDDAGLALASRVPALRGAVSRRLIARISRQNGLIGAAVFVPVADFPALTLNQLRLVLGLASAYGLPLDRERLPEILGVLGGGFGLRALARQLLGAVPVAGWAVKGGVAYAGTRAIGEAALRVLEARTKASDATPRRASASRDEP